MIRLLTNDSRDEEAKPDPNYTNDPLPGYQYWDSHKEFTLDEWADSVHADCTRRGYWEWVRAQLVTTGDVLPDERGTA
jgi:hypothetical protein